MGRTAYSLSAVAVAAASRSTLPAPLGRGAPRAVPPHHPGYGRGVTLDPCGLRYQRRADRGIVIVPERPARGANDRG